MIWLEMAGMFSCASVFCRGCPSHAPALDDCTQSRPTRVPEEGDNAVILTEISPLFDEKGCAGPRPPTAIVPGKVSTWFFDGSTIPPQLTLRTPATASTSAARNRERISRFYTNR